MKNLNVRVADILFGLEEKGGLQIKGFGTFKLTRRPARKARNPKTGEVHHLPERRVVTFKASKALNGKFND